MYTRTMNRFDSAKQQWIDDVARMKFCQFNSAADLKQNLYSENKENNSNKDKVNNKTTHFISSMKHMILPTNIKDSGNNITNTSSESSISINNNTNTSTQQHTNGTHNGSNKTKSENLPSLTTNKIVITSNKDYSLKSESTTPHIPTKKNTPTTPTTKRLSKKLLGDCTCS